MSTHHLEDQARRAERLARSVLDSVTIERLLAFAAECRAKALLLEAMYILTKPTFSRGTPSGLITEVMPI